MTGKLADFAVAPGELAAPRCTSSSQKSGRRNRIPGLEEYMCLPAGLLPASLGRQSRSSAPYAKPARPEPSTADPLKFMLGTARPPRAPNRCAGCRAVQVSVQEFSLSCSPLVRPGRRESERQRSRVRRDSGDLEMQDSGGHLLGILVFVESKRQWISESSGARIALHIYVRKARDGSAVTGRVIIAMATAEPG